MTRRRRGRISPHAAGLVLAVVVLPGATALGGDSRQTAPASAAAQPREFQPGIRIDWQRRAVLAEARVVLREGPLEFLACFSGKEHESILRFAAAAEHLYMALGLVGLTPGRPGAWDDAGRYHLPQGDLVDVSLEWDATSGRRAAQAGAWLLEIEYGRPPLARPWVFTGSQRGADGALTASLTGAGIALVDDPSSLLSLSRSRSSRNAELWAHARSAEIPALDTPVTVVLRPATFEPVPLRVDALGRCRVDGRWIAPEDAGDLLRLGAWAGTAGVQRIQVDRALRSDLERLRQAFDAAGLPRSAYAFQEQ